MAVVDVHISTLGGYVDLWMNKKLIWNESVKIRLQGTFKTKFYNNSSEKMWLLMMCMVAWASSQNYKPRNKQINRLYQLICLLYILKQKKNADLNTSFFTTLAQMLKQNTTNRTFNQIVKQTSLFLILWKKKTECIWTSIIYILPNSI